MSEHKVMFTARLPVELVARITDVAESDGVSRTELVAELLEAAIEERERPVPTRASAPTEPMFPPAPPVR